MRFSIIDKYLSLKFYLKPKKIIAVSRAFYGDEWMKTSLKSVQNHVHKILIVTSDKTWNKTNESPDDITKIFEDLNNQSKKYHLLRGSWDDQIQQQNDFLNFIRENHSECTHILFIDTDEIYEKEEIKKLLELTKKIKTFNSVIRVKMFTYIKSIYYRVSPQEIYQPIAIIPIRNYVYFSDVRLVETCPIYNSEVNMHHFSLVRKKDERIKAKFNNRAKSYNRVNNWFEKYYLNFDMNMKDFHPIIGNENQWHSIKKITPEELPQGVVKRFEEWSNE
jgi:hypothetical protein